MNTKDTLELQKKLDDYNVGLYKPKPKPKKGTREWEDSCEGHIYFDWIPTGEFGDNELAAIKAAKGSYIEETNECMSGKYYKRLGDAINAAVKMEKTGKYNTIEVKWLGGTSWEHKVRYTKTDKSKRDLVFPSDEPVDVEEIIRWGWD
jgi:hypothetical protein